MDYKDDICVVVDMSPFPFRSTYFVVSKLWVHFHKFIHNPLYRSFTMLLHLNTMYYTFFFPLRGSILSMHCKTQCLEKCPSEVLCQLNFTCIWLFNEWMDMMCDGHPWCTIKSINIHNIFELSSRQFTCANHLKHLDDYCEYMHRNIGVCDCRANFWAIV